MPRIPSAADVTPVGAGASRLPTVRAEAQDFGLAIGQGLAGLGDGLAALRPLAEEILRKEEQRQEAEQKVHIAAHKGEIRQAATQMVDDWESDGRSPREAARQASEALAALEDSKLKGVPSEMRAAAKAATAATRAGHGLRIAQRAQNRGVEALSTKAGATLQLLQGQAVREPLAAERYAGEGTALLQSLLAAGALTPDQHAAQNDGFRRSLYAAVIQGQPAVDAVADLEAGVYDAALADPALKDFLLTQARWRLHSERAQGEAAADARVEGARRGAAEQPGVGARTQRLLDAGAMADTELKVERARRVRETLEGLRYAPEAAAREAITGLALADDAADAEERLKVQEEVRLQGEVMLRERRHDPAAYVMGQPAVAEAFAAAEQDPALLGDAVAARLAAQAAMGLPAEERWALTRDESAQILAGLQQLGATQRTLALGALARQHGDQIGPVAADLAEAGLSGLEAQLLDPASDPATWERVARMTDSLSHGQQARSPERDAINAAADALLAEAREAGHARRPQMRF